MNKALCLIALGGIHASKYEMITGYEPHTLITDIAALDQDQKSVEELLMQNQKAAFDQARRFYQEGSNSLPVAYLTLDRGLPLDLYKGSHMTGQSDLDEPVNGTLYADAYKGDYQILFQYEISSDTNHHVSCRVGVSSFEDMEASGCLQQRGEIGVLGGFVNYHYDPFLDNNNGRTLQSLSLNAKRLMFDCQNCPYTDFAKFHSYYGLYDYADALVQAAFEGEGTKFQHGNLDLSQFSLIGRGEAIKKAASFMNVWMYVIGRMEASLDECIPNCFNCNDQALHKWDQAVALYSGSLAGTDGLGHGFFSYALADKRCIDFRTCGYRHDRFDGKSAVNSEVINLFNMGKMDIFNGVCYLARDHKERIVDLMTVPLIQSTLKSVYIKDKQETGEKESAEAAIFAATVLPIIHNCNENDAIIIWENTAASSVKPKFLDVKLAFERNYECLRITCKDVGGLYDSQFHRYFPGADPCGIKSGIHFGKIFIIIICVTSGIFLITCCCLPLRRRRIIKKGLEAPPLPPESAGDLWEEVSIFSAHLI